MIEKVFVDTCILAAYYCPEPLSQAAEKLLLSIDQPIISLFTELELFSVLSKKFRKNELSKKHTHQIMDNFKYHIKEGYFYKTAIKSEHYLQARDLLGSLNYSLHSVDALHLAISTSEQFILATLDTKLAAAAAKIKTKILCISDNELATHN